MDTCFIVGGGSSLAGFDFSSLNGFDTIAVNHSVLSISNPKYFITMDYLYTIRFPNIFNVKTNRIFVENLCPSYMLESNGLLIDTRIGLVYNLSKFDIILKSRSSCGLGRGFNDFVHGANSGFCAFQFALSLGYKNIYLLGMDMVVDKGKTHFHNCYPVTRDFEGELKTYLGNFDRAFPIMRDLFPKINVYSCSRISALNRYVEYKDINSVLGGFLKNGE